MLLPSSYPTDEISNNLNNFKSNNNSRFVSKLDYEMDNHRTHYACRLKKIQELSLDLWPKLQVGDFIHCQKSRSIIRGYIVKIIDCEKLNKPKNISFVVELKIKLGKKTKIQAVDLEEVEKIYLIKFTNCKLKND